MFSVLKFSFSKLPAVIDGLVKVNLLRKGAGECEYRRKAAPAAAAAEPDPGRNGRPM
jgi:hypothetical protein